MRKSLLTFVILVSTCASASADALHRNPSQPAHAASMLTFGQTSIPIGAYQFCERKLDACRPSQETLELRLTRSNWSEIVRINVEINQAVKPMTDRDLYGIEEFWSLPEYAGDCEDYVLAKQQQLSSAGLPIGALRATVVYDEVGSGHAVLTVVTDQGDFILDNNNDEVKRWQDAELTYIKRQAPGDLMSWQKLKPGL